MNAEDTRLTMWVSASKWSKQKQGPQSEANVFRHKCNLEKPRLLIAQDTQQILVAAFSYLELNAEIKIHVYSLFSE